MDGRLLFGETEPGLRACWLKGPLLRTRALNIGLDVKRLNRELRPLRLRPVAGPGLRAGSRASLSALHADASFAAQALAADSAGRGLTAHGDQPGQRRAERR